MSRAARLAPACVLAWSVAGCADSYCTALCKDLGEFYDDCLFEARRGWDAWPGDPGIDSRVDFIELCLDTLVAGQDEAWCEERWPAGLNPASCEEGWTTYGWEAGPPLSEAGSGD